MNTFTSLANQQQGLGGLGSMAGQQISPDSFGFSNQLSNLLGLSSLRGVSELGPDSEGWYDCQYSFAPNNVLLQFKRINSGLSDGVWIGYADFHPTFNIANLYWRYTGIGKHQLEFA